ncbi:hypothetical protein [Thermococcus sp.]|uniref:hypothetical protein n=1 Tax=Thermococcus sp. TaxID=35749 RepID=UPI00261A0929|nr:hypothetical protein [Thermococcus sp.]
MLKKIAVVLVFVVLLVAPAALSAGSGSPQQQGSIHLLAVNAGEILSLISDPSFKAIESSLKDYSLYTVGLKTLLRDAKTGSVSLEIRGRKFELALTPDTRTLAPGVTNGPIHIFRGSVKGVPGSMVALTVSDRAAFVTLWVPGKWYYLRSTKTRIDGKPILIGYSSKDEKHADKVYQY